MTTNEASRVTEAAKELIRIVQKRSYSTLVYSPENAEAFTAACALEAALASSLGETTPIASKIDPTHGDKREVVEWQPIESAPRDGTPVLLIGAPDVPERCDWLTGLQFVGRCTSDLTEWSFAAPVGMGGIATSWLAGWMPLPDAPAPGKGGEA